MTKLTISTTAIALTVVFSFPVIGAAAARFEHCPPHPAVDKVLRMAGDRTV